jgi:hypothetical protein
MPTYTTPMRSTHRFARLRTLIRWDWEPDDLTYTLTFNTLPLGYRIWDTRNRTWLPGLPGSTIHAMVWQVRDTNTWRSRVRANGRSFSRAGTNTQPQVLLRKIEESLVRRFKLVRMRPSDPGYWRYDRLPIPNFDSLQCERGFNGRALPQGTDLMVCRTREPLADASSWRQWITYESGGFVVHLTVGDHYASLPGGSSLQTAQRVADEQWNSHFRIVTARRAQVIMPDAQPRVGAPGFVVEQPAPALPGWAAGWQ